VQLWKKKIHSLLCFKPTFHRNVLPPYSGCIIFRYRSSYWVSNPKRLTFENLLSWNIENLFKGTRDVQQFSNQRSTCLYDLLQTVWSTATRTGCPNKSTRFKVRAIVVLLGWQHWKFNICHLSFLQLVVTEHYAKEQRVVIVKTRQKYGESYAETVRKVRGIFSQWNAPYQSPVTVL